MKLTNKICYIDVANFTTPSRPGVSRNVFSTERIDIYNAIGDDLELVEITVEQLKEKDFPDSLILLVFKKVGDRKNGEGGATVKKENLPGLSFHSLNLFFSCICRWLKKVFIQARRVNYFLLILYLYKYQ